MSQPSSDLDDDFVTAGVSTDEGDPSLSGSAPPPPPRYRKQGFSVYTMMLILSFLFLTTAAILFYVNIGSY